MFSARMRGGLPPMAGGVSRSDQEFDGSVRLQSMRNLTATRDWR